MQDYETFVQKKLATPPPTGFRVDESALPKGLFRFQNAIVRWALRRGRAAVFAGTGLGKTRVQLAWAQQVYEAEKLKRLVAGGAGEKDARVLILAPLAVAAQTVAEGAAIGVSVTLCREAADVRTGLNITNYDRLHKFSGFSWDGVVLDESSCIKHFDSKTLKSLLETFSDTPYKLACTATPAPNDYTELGCHAQFLDVCTRGEMLSEFFVHDGGDTQTWRLKGHAKDAFWRWVASWAALVGHPRDLGHEFDEKGYDLPPLSVSEHLLPADEGTAQAAGVLFAEEAAGLMERRQARRASLEARVKACAEWVNAEAKKGEAVLVWCELNAESEALTKAIPGALEVTGSMSADEKEERLVAFSSGKARVMVTKPVLAGWGLNWQHCARMAFVGVNDSWESYFQAVRRCWRFGQTRPVEVHVFASEVEGAVVANLKRKEKDAEEMAKALAVETASLVRGEVLGAARTVVEYEPTVEMRLPVWLKGEEVVRVR